LNVHKPHGIRQAKRVPKENDYVQPPKSDAKTHRTPKALRSKCVEEFFTFRAALGVRARPRAAFRLSSYLVSVFRWDVPLPHSCNADYSCQVRFFLLLMFSAQAFGAGLGSYSDLVVSDSPATRHNGVRVTYLGTNGYQFEFKGHALLVDPYFSRVDLLSVAAGSRIQPDISRVADGMRHLASNNVWSSAFRRRDIAPESRVNAELQTSPKLDAILVTHGHFDHLFDAPIIMSKTHTRLIASRSSINLVRRMPEAGPIKKRFDAVAAGDVRRIGPWKIRVLPATHDRLFGKVPFDRHEQRSAGLPAEASAEAGPPQRASDWICGEPLAFLIEINGQRIYIDSGGTPAQLPPNEHVDLAILGMALPDSRERLPAALERLHPRYVLPSHQDNFFRPLNLGFQFGPLTDFPRVQRDCARASRNRLILLDYFRPWTLPAAVNPKSQSPNPKERDHGLHGWH
jgi:L-ascorbate metabolism protein UlaG (beta-lactamase superfamily)